MKLALSQPHHLPQLIEATYEQERRGMARLEELKGAVPYRQLAARSEPWPAISAVMVRDAEVVHIKATMEWLSGIRETMEWLLEKGSSGSLRHR